MKKFYEEPQMAVVTFAAEDIVLASFELPGGAGGDRETELN